MTDPRQTPTAMPLNTLGRGGPIVSEFALGTMTFGTETDEAEAFRQLDLFVDHGGTLIDTADGYSAGASEEIIGRWGAKRGGMDDLIIATKCRFRPPPGSHGASRRSVLRSAEASLRRLQIEAIDLYFIHGWDKDTPVLETLRALGDLVHAGKVHNIGWSNVSAWQLQQILAIADAHGLPKPVALQPQYNLLERGIELEVLPCCLDNGLSLTPWSPLGGGWLTGKYTAKAPPSGATRLGEDPNRGVEAYDIRNTDRTHAILDVLTAIADKHARPPSHIALAWLRSRPAVGAILLGARTTAQLKDNLAAIDLTLDPADLNALTKASALGTLPYPYNFLQDWCGMDFWRRFGT
ncbi:aldo/keto reductase [Aestuariibius sp. 2305UL40-4]|uniref:aldo/keto reductase n=1 Tax=Aestuariibius violaceus TaxID=3234132 RepID=UPI00345EDF24